MSDLVAALGGGINIGATGLVILFVLAILTGRLLPRSTFDIQQKALDKQAEQLDRLIENLETPNRFIRALINAADLEHESEEDNE